MVVDKNRLGKRCGNSGVVVIPIGMVVLLVAILTDNTVLSIVAYCVIGSGVALIVVGLYLVYTADI